MECADGEQVLVVYREQQPDRVFDGHSDGRDGRSDPHPPDHGAFPEARVLIVSQFNGLHLRAAVREAGACGYILKDNPMRAREFVEAQSPAQARGLRVGTESSQPATR